jgi:rhodanese-related sulfurtransferase
VETLLMQEIDLDSFAAAHAAGGLVIDVREPEEYVDGHVPGARLMPLSRLGALAADVPGGQPVYVICASGNRSKAGAGLLAQRGIEAYSVAGGTGGWADAGRPLVAGVHER